MNKKNYVAVATLAFAMLTSCAGQKEAKSTSGIDLANMDTTVSAGTDFFRYACGGWNDAHPLTADILVTARLMNCLKTARSSCAN